MLRESMHTDVEKATVTLLGKGGLGVFVGDGLIITAAHCINFSCKGEMVLEEPFIEKIKTGKKELVVTTLAVEPVSDLAVLGSLDNQECATEAEDFEEFCENTTPVPLCRREDYVLFQKFQVHIYTHKGTWVTGSAEYRQPAGHSLAVKFDEQIEGGTSGGPIINDSGELVAIISQSNLASEGQRCIGRAPCPYFALPVWVYRRFFGGTC